MNAPADGVHRLAVPTPFMIGRVNAYLIEGSPLTLVDSGPNSATSLDTLERLLGERGVRVEDLELLVLSHQHIDHLGLLAILARRSGAEVAALAALGPYLADYSARTEAEDGFAEALMLRHGVPEGVAAALRAVSRAFGGWGAGAEVTRPLADGDVIELADRRLEVLHRPGHSPSDTVFHDPDRRVLLAADHLLGHVSSNPLLTRPLEGDSDARPRALATYMASMRATRAMDLDLVLPGHGEPIEDHRALIDERFRMHARRAAKIHRLLDDGPRSAHELAGALWGDVAVTQAYLTLSEVLGHLDLLLDEGRVVEEDGEHGVTRFAATGRADDA